MEGVGAIKLLIFIGCAIVVGENVSNVEGKIRIFLDRFDVIVILMLLSAKKITLSTIYYLQRSNSRYLFIVYRISFRTLCYSSW